MCGICGFVLDNGDFDIKEKLTSMSRTLIHRGPDEEGMFFKDRVGMAIRRLSIVDVIGGKQPIHNEDKNIWVVANAEIYNFKDLTNKLESCGHKFYTKSDIEVIVHAYEEWGLDFINMLRGMFAISLWDDRSKRLILVRDKFGIKPLFYLTAPQGVYFASEVRAFRACKEINLKINKKGLYTYLNFNYIMQPDSVYMSVKQLLPAHYLIFQNGKLSEHEYWDMKPRELIGSTRKMELEDLDSILNESVKSHLIGDVPIGIFLSGGIDSSIILRYFSRYQDNISVFSIGFSEPSYDESRFARIVNNRYGGRHFIDIIDSKRWFKEFPTIVSKFDEPFADSSSIGVYFLSKMAAKFVKVILTGEGGDEVFGGYDTYIADAIAPYYRRLPLVIKSNLLKALELLPVSDKKVGLEERIKRFVKFAPLDSHYSHLYWRRIFDDSDLEKLLPEGYIEHELFPELDRLYNLYFKKMDNFKGLSKFRYFDLRAYLPSDMLVKIDRIGMAHSIEARVPLLDTVLVEKVFGIQNKTLLRKILRKDFSPNIAFRKKAGFNMPIGKWIREQVGFKELLFDEISKLNHYCEIKFNIDYIKILYDNHISGKQDNAAKLYNLAVFALWRNNCEN